MNNIGAQEIMMPIVQPAEIWHESGRWNAYGPEMFKLEDRHGGQFCLGPTHEELITTLVRNELRSYKQMPVTLWQMQNKYRDEIRPRFGLMRSREFVMKDAYSFDVDEEGSIRAIKTNTTPIPVSLPAAVWNSNRLKLTAVRSAAITA